jgi:hypothetical protein
MKRFQIYLEPEQHETLERIARRKGCNLSQVVRDAISELIEREEPMELRPLERIEDHPLWELVGMIPADPDAPVTYGSTTYKEDLYGKDRRWRESS